MTINDIAELAGVSKSTVSRYLTGGSVSKRSSEKIARAIEETGFELNINASRLRGGGSKLIGVLVDSLMAPAVAREVTAMNETLAELGYLPFVVIDKPGSGRKVRGMQALVRQGVDAIIFGTARLSDEQVRSLHEVSVPVLVLGQKSESFPYVKVDDFGAGRMLGEHVAEHCNGSIVFVSHPHSDQAAGLERWLGFQDAFNGRTVRLTSIETGYGMGDAYAVGEQVLAAEPEFIACGSDQLCLGIMSYLAEHGLSVPEDVRMAGFGNHQASRLPQVCLTSLAFDYEALGRDAARKAVALVEGQSVEWACTDYPMELIVRRSSGE